MKYTLFFSIVFLLVACEPPPGEQDAIEPLKLQSDQVRGIARVEPELGLLDISSNVAGRIDAVLVNVNNLVKKGQCLVQLDDAVEKAQLAQAKAKLYTHAYQIEAAKASVESLSFNLEKLRLEYERNVSLFAIKALTNQTLEESRLNFASKEQEYKEKIATLNEYKFKQKELESDVDYYKALWLQRQICAPYDGKVLSIDIHAGDIVSIGSSIGKFAPNGKLIAKTEIDELFIDKVKIGQRTIIYSQATNKELASGTVYFISDYLKNKSLFDDESSTEDRRVKEIRVYINDAVKIPIGAKVDCSILLRK